MTLELSQFPTINACLNGLAGLFLILGFMAIKSGNRQLHQKFMLCAFFSSMLFLGFYLTYHVLEPGITRYIKTGISKYFYFFILGTHTPLAMIIVPASLGALYFAIRKNFEAHKKITRWLLPIWVYVSITGVLIYLMLYTFKGRGY